MTPNEATSDAVETPDAGSEAASGETAAKPRKKRRWGRRLGLAALIGAGGLAALPALLSTGWVNGVIGDWLVENVDRPVEFDTLDVSWQDGITITNLRVHEEDRAGPPMLTAPLVKIDAKLLPLLYREVKVTQFVIHDPVIRISKEEDRFNTEGALKRKKKRKKKRDKDEVDEPDEALVLPRINVPVEVRNATIVFVNEEGREARQGNIQLNGHLSTRDGPSTFEFSASDSPTSSISAKGTVTLFDADGMELDAFDREVDATVTIENVNAATNRDILALFLGDSPAAGVVNGKLTVRTRGSDADGYVELVVTGIAVGDAVGVRDTTAEDLRIKGSFHYARDIVRVNKFVITGDGLDARLSVEGDMQSLVGGGSFHADLDRMRNAMAAMGIEISGLAGQVTGNLDFSDGGTRGVGSLVATNVFIPSPVEGRPPVSLDGSRIDFVISPQEGGVMVENARLTMPAFSADARGVIGIGKDGGLDVTTKAAGDLELVLGRLRDLGLAPKDLALAGKINAEIRTVRGTDGGKPSVVIERFDVTGDDVSIRIKGTRSPDGQLDFTASGQGDIQKLLGAAARGSDANLAAVHGRFDFAARASGTDKELDVLVERLHLDGDVQVDASARLAPNGALSGSFAADGQVDRLVSLLRRMGLLEANLVVGGKLHASATIAGTRENPEIPDLTINLFDGPITASIRGKRGSDGAIEATVDATSGVDDLLDIARSLGKFESSYRPGGTVELRAVIGGTGDKTVVPTAQFRVTGPLSVEATGSLDAAGHVQAKATMNGRLQPLLAAIAAQRETSDVPHIEGTIDGELVVDGPRDALTYRLSRLDVRSGAVALTGTALRRPDGATEGEVTAKGSLTDLLEIAHGLGHAEEYHGSGVLDARVGATTLDGSDRLRVSVAAALQDIGLLRSPADGSEPTRYHTNQLSLDVAPFTMDPGTKEHDPIAATLRLGDATAELKMLSGLASYGPLDATVTGSGALQPILDLAAFVTGGTPTQVGGTFEFDVRASGTRDAPRYQVPSLRLESGGLTARVTATLPDEKTADVDANVSGEVSRALAIAQAFGKGTERQATGRFELDVNAKMRDGLATASVDATATDLVVTDPTDPDSKPTREPRLHITANDIRYDKASGRIEPFRLVAEALGARVEGTFSYAEGAIPTGATDPAENVSIDGTVLVTRDFAANHPEFFDEIQLERLEGPVRFSGDISRGRDGAATWNGALDLRATQLTAPHVRADWLQLTGTVGNGAVEITRLEGLVNDGTVTGTAHLGLLGKHPEHRIDLDAKDVTVDGALAPLLARASPLLATGEEGTVSGKTGIVAHLTANGLKGKRIKKTVNGNGVLRLRDVTVRSSGWVGKLLDFTGAGNLLQIANAEVPFTVENGKVTTDDIPIDVVGLPMKLGGTATTQGDLDYRLKVKPSGGSSGLTKYGALFDKDGYLPLRLEGDISDPSLKLPSIKDILGGGGGDGDSATDKVKDIWDKLRGKDEEKDGAGEEPVGEDGLTDEQRRKRRERRKRRKKKEQEAENDGVPPPPR